VGGKIRSWAVIGTSVHIQGWERVRIIRLKDEFEPYEIRLSGGLGCADILTIRLDKDLLIEFGRAIEEFVKVKKKGK
jgi:hypothetical protein